MIKINHPILNILKKFGSLAIALSGGIDSSFLLAAAKQALKNRVIAITSVSCIHSKRETNLAINIAKNLNVKQILVDCRQIDSPAFISNNTDRCYICKSLLFKKIKKIASLLNIDFIAHGENTDDLNQFRPGFNASIEMGIKSPLIKANMDKKEIRTLAKEIGLTNWNKPSVSCLAAKIRYNDPITIKKIKMIESAETTLLDFRASSSKVKSCGEKAIIEASYDNSDIISKNIEKITNEFKKIGFKSVNLDILKI